LPISSSSAVVTRIFGQNHVSNIGYLDNFFPDKKNENKEVAVDEFLGADHAVEAIAHSMDLYAQYIVESLRR
jgi:hypothetical protein